MGLVVVAVGAVAALVGAVVAAVIVVRVDGRGNPEPAAAATSTASTAPATTSLVPQAIPSPTVDTAAEQRSFLAQVDEILQQSAQGRAQVSNVVAGVVNGCSVPPEVASETIADVSRNRRSVLGQASALDTSSGGVAADVRQKLIDALTASIAADNQYEQWLDYLYARYFDAYPVGCPFGAAPIDDHYRQATQASASADVAKRTFIAAYDPAAAQFGLRQWADTDF